MANRALLRRSRAQSASLPTSDFGVRHPMADCAPAAPQSRHVSFLTHERSDGVLQLRLVLGIMSRLTSHSIPSLGNADKDVLRPLPRSTPSRNARSSPSCLRAYLLETDRCFASIQSRRGSRGLFQGCFEESRSIATLMGFLARSAISEVTVRDRIPSLRSCCACNKRIGCLGILGYFLWKA